MKRIVLTSLVAFSLAAPVAGPARAQDAGTPDEGLSLMERGAQMFLEGILREMEPAMRDLRDLAEDMGPELRRFVQEMGPAFGELMGKIDDLSAYHPPEMLPNGDIIMRRKTPDEIEPAPPKEGEIDI
ncbi:hypothetical protein RAZWK3B_20296 [Roseobacter sp. AzwK-3b]|uniref:hypothetical protein n=1 Tax=Roseobacter sp. AzwK-3b TaxID=351016 RepID=UPI0001569854|nr:hypothetical protein [Roseobacter sp. AzwK-3b]EDM71730.1 hypothetical protein RAZWK3B_20296 [Roseobacter sp. AzwK-3b]